MGEQGERGAGVTGGGRRGRPGGTPGAHKLTLTCLRPFKGAFSPKSPCDAGVMGKEHLGPSVRGLCGWLPCQGPPCPRQRMLPTRRRGDSGRSGAKRAELHQPRRVCVAGTGLTRALTSAVEEYSLSIYIFPKEKRRSRDCAWITPLFCLFALLVCVLV